MQQHWKNDHRNMLFQLKPKKRYQHPVAVQSYFCHTSNTCWTVNPELADRPEGDGDLYRAFLRDFVPKFKEDIHVTEPTHSRDIHPWLKVAGFHEYLGEYVTDEQKRAAIVDAAARPGKDSVYHVLHDWVFKYLDQVRAISKTKVPRTFLKHILLYCEE
jgi:hypothetical protein